MRRPRIEYIVQHRALGVWIDVGPVGTDGDVLTARKSYDKFAETWPDYELRLIRRRTLVDEEVIASGGPREQELEALPDV